MAEKSTVNNCHFVLVHGACHGAWCFYKLKPLLETAGHRVTALDLSASSINMTDIHQVRTLEEYSAPLLQLLEAMSSEEGKLILVGHSLGGYSLALATNTFPHKVAAAVYVTAFMPDTANSPAFIIDQYSARVPEENWLDTEFSPYSASEKHLTTMVFGPKFLEHKLYQNCSAEDLELAKSLVRPGSLFVHDLKSSGKLSSEGYGSVPRIYIVCDEDNGIPAAFQRWMIENYPAKEVKEIKGSDHMPMLCKPRELCQCLGEVARDYA